MAMTKKPNTIVRYFTPFGLKQIADVLIVVASVVLAIGLIVDAQNVVITGIAGYAFASLIAICMCLKTMFSGINKRAPAYKSAFANLIIMTVILLISILALIYSIAWYYS